MDRHELQRMVNDAVNRANVLVAYQMQGEVVLAMSRDIYHQISDNIIHTNYGDYIVTYQGFRVGLINEDTSESMIFPALVGMTYHEGMQIDDAIIVDEDNKLFQLVSKEPVRFNDTGMTVGFVHNIMEHHAEMSADVAASSATDIGNASNHATFTGDFQFDSDIFSRMIHNTWTYEPDTWTYEPVLNSSNAWFERTFDVSPYSYSFTPSTHHTTTSSRPKKAKKDDELSAGDTKMLDDFLDSFLRNGA